MARELNLLCDTCKKPIDDSKPGTLWIGSEELNTQQDARAAWETAHTIEIPGGGTVVSASGADIMEHPERAHWQAHHDACDDGSTADAYSISSSKLKTWADLTSWTAHLMEKVWLRDTDWVAVLSSAAEGDAGPVRPVTKPRLNA